VSVAWEILGKLDAIWKLQRKLAGTLEQMHETIIYVKRSSEFLKKSCRNRYFVLGTIHNVFLIILIKLNCGEVVGVVILRQMQLG
jgi:hypothetical protein